LSDALANGRTLHVFNLIDGDNREALSVKVDLSLSGERVIRSLE